MEDKFIQLTGAVYKLLDFFPEGEPLKNRAKEKALSIMDNRNNASGQFLEDIEVLLNYLKLAKSFGWIDSINFLIISKEYEKIRGQVSQPTKKAENTKIVAQTQKVTFQKTIENQASFTEEKISQLEVAEFSISDRQKKILQILSEKGHAQVSDFKTVLNDVTKRTIRRDLDELLKNGEIIRAGEWNQVFYQLGH